MTRYHIQSLHLSLARIKNDSSRSNCKRNPTIACDRSDATIDASENLSFDSEPSHLKSCLAGKSQRNNTSNSNSTKSKSVVRFDKVEVREYELVLSDNPCMTSGPAISLGWNYNPSGTLQTDIDSYEADRHSSHHSGSSSSDLRISPGERVAMLLSVGYSPVEIQESIEERRKYQDEQGRRSCSSLKKKYQQKYDPIFFEKVETLKNTVKRFKPSSRRRQFLQ